MPVRPFPLCLLWSLTNAHPQESSIHDFGELYSSGDEPHPYFEWYDSEFDTRIPESTSDISDTTLPSSPSLKWLPGAPSTATATGTPLPPLQPFNECQSHVPHIVPALATHLSQHCVVEYEASHDSPDVDETDESSLACDDTLDLDKFETMPLITAFADDDLDESSMSSSTSTSPSGWTSSFQAYNDDTEPSFDIIPFGPHSPVLVPQANPAANPWTSRLRSSSSSTRATEEEAPARPARDEHSEFPRTLEKFRSEDSTRLFFADQLPADNAKKFSKALVRSRRSGRPSYSTSTSTSISTSEGGDHVNDDDVLWLESSYARWCIFGSGSQSQILTSSEYSESSSFQSEGSSVTSSFVAAAHLDATRDSVRRGWLKTLATRVRWLGPKCTLRTRVCGRNEGGG